MNLKLLDKKIGGLILVGVAVLSLLYLLVIRPQQAELRRIKVELQEKEALYAKLGALSRLIDELREKKIAIGETMDRFLKMRERGEMGLVVPESLMQIFRASYNQLGHFIGSLERSDDFNRVDRLTISPGGSPSEYRVQLVISRISLLKKEPEK